MTLFCCSCVASLLFFSGPLLLSLLLWLFVIVIAGRCLERCPADPAAATSFVDRHCFGGYERGRREVGVAVKREGC